MQRFATLSHSCSRSTAGGRLGPSPVCELVHSHSVLSIKFVLDYSTESISMATRAVLTAFERYQKERTAFVSTVAEMAKGPQARNVVPNSCIIHRSQSNGFFGGLRNSGFCLTSTHTSDRIHLRSGCRLQNRLSDLRATTSGACTERGCAPASRRDAASSATAAGHSSQACFLNRLTFPTGLGPGPQLCLIN